MAKKYWSPTASKYTKRKMVEYPKWDRTVKQESLDQLRIRLESEKVAWSKHHKNCYGPSLKDQIETIAQQLDLISKKETKAV